MIGIGTNLKYQPSIFKRKSGASLEYLFGENGSTSPYEGTAPIVVTRAGATASRWKIDGTLDTAVAENEPRIDYDPTTIAYQNLWTYSRDFTTSAWSYGTNLGNFFTVTQNAYVGPTGQLDAVKFVSTASTAQGLFLRAIQSKTAATYNTSIYIYMPTQAGVTNWSILFDAQDSADSATTATQTTFDAWVRVDIPITYTATRTFLDFNIRYNGGTVPSAAGFTFYASRAQLNTGSTALPYRQTVTVPLTEYAWKGLLVEESRTNSIRNNSMQGAAAGTPGTLPTNWSTFTYLTGLARTVVGTGTENGIDYIDIQLSGTPSGAGSYYINFESAAQVSASNGQTWTSSAYYKLVGGSLTGVSLIRHATTARDSGGAALSDSSTALTPTSSGLATQRTTNTQTFANASTAYANSYVELVLSGAAINITLRIGLPQLEQGAFASSVIRTTSAAVTRNADVAIVSQMGGWFNASEGTIVCEFDGQGISTDATDRLAWALGDAGTFNESMYLERVANSTGLAVSVVDGGTAQIASNSSGTLGSSVVKHAFAYKANDFAWCKDGGAVSTDTAGSLPTVNVLALGKASWGNFNFLSGHIKRLAYFPRRLTNTELQQYTT